MKKLLMVAGCSVGLVAAMVVAADKAAGDKTAEKAAGDRPGRGEWHSGMGMMEGDMPMMPLMQMHKDLGLTPEQIQQIKDAASGSTKEMEALRSKMQAAAKAQAELMGQDSPNEEAILKGTDEIGKIRTDMARIRVKQMLAMQKVLTPEQRTKMREKMKAQMEKRREMGDRMKTRGEAGRKGHGKAGDSPDAGQAPAKEPEAQ